METKFELSIKGIALDKTSQMPILLLENKQTTQIIPLWIGPSEASAILIELEDVHPPRPLTHDILSELFIRHKLILDEVYIYRKLDYKKYLCRIYYHLKRKKYSMEVRPSDGIALALRLDSNIVTNNEVVEMEKSQDSFFQFSESMSSEMLYVSNDKNFHPIM